MNSFLRRAFFRAFFFLPFLILASSCALKKVNSSPALSPSSPTSVVTKTGERRSNVEPAARPLFFQAEQAFNSRDYDRALTLYEEVREKFPKFRAAKLASYRIGSIYYYQENYPAASKEFESFLSRYPRSDLNLDVTYNLAATEYQQEHYENAYRLLSRLRISEVQAQGVKRASVIFKLTAQAATALGDHSAAIAAYGALLELPLNQDTRTNLEDAVAGHLSKMDDVSQLKTLLNSVSEPATHQKIAQRIADLTHPAGVETQALPSEAPNHAPIGTTNVGVILPLTGRFAPYGHKALEGILLAAKNYEKDGQNPFRVYVEDTRSNPAVAAIDVDELVKQHDVSAIIGPLNWKEALAVADRAQALGVVNLSLTSKEGISERGSYLFQNALTPSVQLQSLVEYCVEKKGFKRFAILAPASPFGKDMSNEFWSAAEALGGKIVAYETYAPDEKDFQKTVKEMTGLNPAYRHLEWARLNDYIKDQRAKTGRDPKSKIEPIVDFDAVFIPDNPKTAAEIAASLAYFDVSGPVLLGTTEWNSPQLYEHGGKYVEGALFPGALGSNSKNEVQRDFIAAFTQSYGTPPDLLAGLSYEAMDLIEAAAERGASSHQELAARLADLKDFATPLGTVTFDSARLAKRQLAIFTLAPDGNILEP